MIHTFVETEFDYKRSMSGTPIRSNTNMSLGLRWKDIRKSDGEVCVFRLKKKHGGRRNQATVN